MVSLELRGRVRDVVTGDTLRSSFEVVAAALGDARHELGAAARFARGLVRDHGAPGLAPRRRDRAVVPGRDRSTHHHPAIGMTMRRERVVKYVQLTVVCATQ